MLVLAVVYGTVLLRMLLLSQVSKMLPHKWFKSGGGILNANGAFNLHQRLEHGNECDITCKLTAFRLRSQENMNAWIEDL